MTTTDIHSRNLFRFAASALLLASAILKTKQLYESPLADSLILESRTITCLLSAAEVLLAVWLLSGWRQLIVRKVAIVMFAVFCSGSCFKWLVGAESCGCFGEVRVPPAVTFVLDLVVLAGLAYWQPLQTGFGKKGLALWFSVATAGVLATILIPLMAPDFVDAEIGQTTSDGSMIVMMSASWIGKPVPIVKFIRGDHAYLTGNWQLILFHEDCGKCQRLIADLISTNPPMPVVMVEIPPYQALPRPDSDQIQWRRLSDEKEWFVSAPIILDLRDGVVTKVVDP